MPPPVAKKPLFPTTDDPIVSEPIQPATVVVIHPGSYNLRIGRASDAYPVSLPHCIARKIKSSPPRPQPSDWILRDECKACATLVDHFLNFQHPECGVQVKEGVKAVEELLLSRPTLTGEYRQLTPFKQLASFNKQAQPEKLERVCSQKWTNTEGSPPFFVGEEALYVSPKEGYQLSWPMRHGRLNIHDKPGGSLTAVLADLESIWSSAIYSQLQIPTKDLKHYRAVLLIPDIYTHKHVKAMVDLLLNNLGFEAVIVHQESVCATYGAGVTCACVVDIGDQKTSVCCVEDGISHKATRITMEYGGSDVSRCLHWLLRRSGASLPEINLNFAPGILQLMELKEAFCHLDQDRLGVRPHVMSVKLPQQNIIKYSLRLGDEMILSPLALFRPEALGLQGAHLIRTQPRSEGDPDDPHDEDYLRRTQRQSQQGRLKKDTADISRDTTDPGLTNMDDSMAPTNLEDDSNDVPENGDDLKRKMYSCLLLVGGGMGFEGAQTWLQYQVWMQMPVQHRMVLETMDVITRPKDMDSGLVSWKGAAILACLDSSQELWIRQKEWRQFSVRMLRERAPFIW
ncbi:hypothetical protein BaRGS_00025086 [Batillaria attramentaria]|uniref:Actin-related protein 8 n=1 Tax=Batillaria attramentaria TaxID=370345 RepID=A0ABD0K9B2_9CAEN